MAGSGDDRGRTVALLWLSLNLFPAFALDFFSNNNRSYSNSRSTDPTYCYDTPAYSHMVRRSTEVFAEPKSGAWLYFVAVPSYRKYYMHWTLTSIQSLINTGTKYDIVVVLEGDDDGGMAEALYALGVHKVHKYEDYLKKLSRVDMTALHKSNEASKESYYHTWDKLLGWTFLEYEKAVLIDSDIVAWNNPDDVFAYPELAAVQDGVWPLMSKDFSEYFNAGLLVIRPDLATFEHLVAGIDTFERPDVLTWEVGEQTYLNAFFNASWYHLPVSYNYVALLLGGALQRWEKPDGLKLVHHLRESFARIPKKAAECNPDDWYTCKQCCHHLVRVRDDAFTRLHAAGFDLSRIEGHVLREKHVHNHTS